VSLLDKFQQKLAVEMHATASGAAMAVITRTLLCAFILSYISQFSFTFGSEIETAAANKNEKVMSQWAAFVEEEFFKVGTLVLDDPAPVQAHFFQLIFAPDNLIDDDATDIETDEGFEDLAKPRFVSDVCLLVLTNHVWL